MRKKPHEIRRKHGKEIGKHKPISTAAGRRRTGRDAEKRSKSTIKIIGQIRIIDGGL